MNGEIVKVWLGSYAFDLGRYVVAAGIAFLIFRVWGRERFRHRLVQRDYAAARHVWREVRYSMSTAIVFSLVGTVVFYGTRARVLRLYEDVSAHGVAWLGASFVILIVLQDAYFYVTHRAMHHQRFFALVHRAHHLSMSPSPWAAYAFSPIEALVHAAFVPLALLVVPVHTMVLFAFLGFMIIRNVIGHLGVELFPRGFTRSRVWGWSTTTTHHDLHHRTFRTNFGLYFTWLDRLCGTTDARYEGAFDAVTTGRPPR
jgi:sterol desaturase/sphingolipid hydroxylase (fatty acid hydroxylase superfamily)